MISYLYDQPVKKNHSKGSPITDKIHCEVMGLESVPQRSQVGNLVQSDDVKEPIEEMHYVKTQIKKTANEHFICLEGCDLTVDQDLLNSIFLRSCFLSAFYFNCKKEQTILSEISWLLLWSKVIIAPCQ